MASKQGQTKEFFVRIPKTEKRRLTILKFNESLNVKPQQWTTEMLKMEREDNRRQGVNLTGEILQEFGEGSEYGKAAREESRRKKYGRYARKYEHDKQPWKMEIEQQEMRGNEEESGGGLDGKTEGKKVRKFRSIREAGAGEHADYWVFYKSGGNDLEAHKVDEWYQFLPAVTYKYLDAEQAEEHFKEMDKIVNQLAFKAQIQKQLAEQDERQQKEALRKGGPSSLKIKDEASSDEEEGAGEGAENGAGKESGKGAKKKAANNKKKTEQAKKEKKKQRVKNADEVAAYESDDGDDEGREYDYMSDSGTDTDREELNVDKKMDEDLVGVEDEKGLKGSLESDEEDEDADEEEKAEEAKGESGKEEEDEEMPNEEEGAAKKEIRSSKAVKTVEKMMAQKVGKNAIEFDDEQESSGAESDEEDPDSEKVTSVLFIQDKRKKQTNQLGTGTSAQGQQRKRPAEEESGGDSAMEKLAAETAKRPKLSAENDDKASDVINEAFIRKLLERKPHSTKQLLTKVKQRLQQLEQQNGGGEGGGGGDELPKHKDKKFLNQLAVILKKIEPYQFRKKNGPGGKEVLYFSMNRTA